MRKILLLEHVSLDGFAATKNKEMNWIKIGDDIFDHVGEITKRCDTAIYGRITYGMMEAYWPTAGEKPGATKHDKEHADWANKSLKLVFSRTMKSTSWKNTRIISSNILEEMQKLKKQQGKDMLMIGSPGIAQEFMKLGLIDEFFINVNPIALGEGIPLFRERIELKLLDHVKYDCGVIGMHFGRR